LGYELALLVDELRSFVEANQDRRIAVMAGDYPIDEIY